MSEAEAWQSIRDATPHLQEQLGLLDWSIKVNVGRLDDDVAGEVQVDAPYLRAVVTLDLERLDSEEELLRTLRHELIHVSLWAFGHYATVMGTAVQGMTDYTAEAVERFAVERLVCAVEGILDRAGLPLRPQP